MEDGAWAGHPCAGTYRPKHLRACCWHLLQSLRSRTGRPRSSGCTLFSPVVHSCGLSPRARPCWPVDQGCTGTPRHLSSSEKSCCPLLWTTSACTARQPAGADLKIDSGTRHAGLTANGYRARVVAAAVAAESSVASPQRRQIKSFGLRRKLASEQGTPPGAAAKLLGQRPCVPSTVGLPPCRYATNTENCNTTSVTASQGTTPAETSGGEYCRVMLRDC